VTVVGDGNIVNTTFTDLSRVLHEMRNAVLESPRVEDERKLEIAADIDSLQAQIQKPTPIRSLVKTLWSGIEKAVTAAGFADLVNKALPLIGPLIS
jgi:hypothetical protein